MIRDSLRHQLEHVASSLGCEAAIDVLIQEARECVYIINADSPSLLGSSRIGGYPDLAAKVDWPNGQQSRDRETYADFFAQINLQDIPSVDGVVLPQLGVLSLFLTAFGNEISFGGIYKAQGANGLAERKPPENLDPVFGRLTKGSTSLRFEPGISLPIFRRDFYEMMEETCDEPLEDLAGKLQPSKCAGCIGGYTFNSQGQNLRVIPALKNLGRSDLISHALWGRKEAWLIEHRERISAEEESWNVIMRFYTNYKVNFCIGDSYPLWIFGRSPDIFAGGFNSLVAVPAP